MDANDDYSDVDWSDGDGGIKNDEGDQSEGGDDTLHLNIGVTTSSSKKDDKKPKRVSVSYTVDEHAAAVRIHQSDLRSGYYRALLVSRWCDDDFLAAILISLLPTDLIHMSQKQRNTSVDDIEIIATWFTKEFTKLKDNCVTADEGKVQCCLLQVNSQNNSQSLL